MIGKITPADLDWWLDLAPTLSWRFAKTMREWPHSYIIRDEMLGAEDFARATRVIRTFGTPAKFFNATRIYLVKDETKWWTMDGTVEECFCINTAGADQQYGVQDAPSTKTDLFTVYDSLATVYDNRYTSPQCHVENEAIRKLIMRHFGAYAPTVLDVGCGTGLLLDMGVTAPVMYHGVDSSQGMLNELLRKHPKVQNLTASLMENAVDQYGHGQFEAVVSLFGSPSYIAPDVIEKLPSLSSDLTVLMHYRQGYLPDYWEGLTPPEHIDSSREAARHIGGKVFTLNNFQVTVVQR